MADINLITADPFTKSYREGLRFGTEQRSRDFELEQAQIGAKQQADIDKALRAEIERTQGTIAPANITPFPDQTMQPGPGLPPSPPPTQAPVAASPQQPIMQQSRPAPAPQPPLMQQSRPAMQQPAPAMPQQPQAQPQPRANFAGALAQVPGGGPMAAEFQMQDEARREEGQRNALIAWANYSKTGNPVDLQAAQHMTAQSGLRLPPGFESNIQNVGLIARGMLLGEKLYKQDPQIGHAFLKNWMASGGNVEQAIAATGAPRGSNMSVQTVMDAGKRYLAVLDSMSGEVTFARTPGGNRVEMPAPYGGRYGGSSTAKVQLMRFLLDNGIAQNPQEAWMLANQAVQNPRKVYADVYSRIFNNLTTKRYMDPSEAQVIASEQAMKVVNDLREMFDPGGSMMPGGAPAAEPPAAEPPAAEPPADSNSSLWNWLPGSDTSQADIPGPENYAHRARFNNGQIIYTLDGVNWYFEDGTKVPNG